MPSGRIVNFDTPWEIVLETARQPLPRDPATRTLARTSQRDLLSAAELRDLVAPASIVFLDARKAPQKRGPREEFLRQQVADQGQQRLEHFFDWKELAAARGTKLSLVRMRYDQDDIFPNGESSPGGNEFDFRAPLAYRLEGDSCIPASALLLTKPNRGLAFDAIHPEDNGALAQLHELFHARQLCERSPEDSLSQDMKLERDADHGAVTAFQTFFNGAPAVAARYMLQRVVEAGIGVEASYNFWPGMTEEEMFVSPLISSATQVAGLFNHLGLRIPGAKARYVCGASMLTTVPDEEIGENRAALQAFKRVTRGHVSRRGERGASVDILRGIIRHARNPETELSPDEESFARKVSDAMQVLAPSFS